MTEPEVLISIFRNKTFKCIQFHISAIKIILNQMNQMLSYYIKQEDVVNKCRIRKKHTNRRLRSKQILGICLYMALIKITY